MKKVREINAEAIGAAKAAVDGLEPDEGHQEIERLLSRHGPLFRFLTESAAGIAPKAVELALYLGVVVYRAYEAAYPDRLATADAQEIRAAQGKNVRWAESHASASDPLAADSDEPFLQPHVMGYVLESLQGANEGALALDADERVELFLLLKTFVDVLDRTAGRPLPKPPRHLGTDLPSDRGARTSEEGVSGGEPSVLPRDRGRSRHSPP